MNTKLYVGNLSFDITESQLRDAFGSFGTLTDVFVPADRDSGRPRGFAFLTFETAEAAHAAIEKMNGTEMDGRMLTVNEAKPKEEGAGGRSKNFGPNRRPFQARKRY